MKTVDSDTVNMGDEVGFKHEGLETYGKVVKILRGYVSVEIWNSQTCESEIINIPTSSIWID